MATQKIETGLIADSAVTTAKLADNSVTAAKIAAGSLDDQLKGISSSADAVAITIDSSENVGIGGTASDANLQVRKTGVNIGITNVLINATFADGSNATGLSIGYRTDETTAVLAPRTATGNLAFYNYDGAWSESMRITNSNKVIIGDTASHVDDLLQIETPASGGGHGIQIRRNDSNNDQGVGHIQFGNNTDTDLAKISAKTDGSTDNAALLFHTQPNGGSLTERMRIESSGQILITNQTPSIKFVDSGDNSAQFIQAYGGFLRYYADDNNILSGSEHSWWIDGGRKMTLDSSGRLGIGTDSPSAKLDVKSQLNMTNSGNVSLFGLKATTFGYSSSYKVLQLGDSASSTAANVAIGVDLAGNSSPAFTGSGERVYFRNGIRFATPNSSNNNYHEYIALKDGNVGIGTTSPNHDLHIQSTDPTLILAQSGSINNANSGRILFAESPSYTTSNSHFEIKYDGLENHLYFGSPIDGSIDLFVVGRDGNVGIGIANQSGVRLYVDAPANTHASVFRNDTVNFAPIVVDNQATSGTRQLISFRLNNVEVGRITSTGSSTAYNTTSDYRLKENVDYTWDATTRLKQLKPARFNFIADADTTVDGFLAHEVSSVVPEAISGTKDAVDSDGNPEYQGIDQSKLVPLLVKTIQELEARITALES